MKKTIKIEGMSCGHCSAAVEKALRELDNVKDVSVNLEGKFAEVEVDESVNDNILKSAVEEAGYEVVTIS